MQLDRPFVLALELTEDVDLATGDLVALDGAFLSMERAHVTDEGLGDGGWYFDRFAGHGPNIGGPVAYGESSSSTCCIPSTAVSIATSQSRPGQLCAKLTVQL